MYSPHCSSNATLVELVQHVALCLKPMSNVVAGNTAARLPDLISPFFDLNAQVHIERWGSVTSLFRLGLLCQCRHLSKLLSLGFCLFGDVSIFGPYLERGILLRGVGRKQVLDSHIRWRDQHRLRMGQHVVAILPVVVPHACRSNASEGH